MEAMKPVITALRIQSLLLLLVSCFLTFPLSAQNQLAALAGEGGVLLHSPDGEVLVSLNPDQSLVPASLVKIPLAQVALNSLGEDFRFETHFYRNETGDLLVRGLGDPFLVSEEIAAIAEVLSQRGLAEVRRLVMDDSAFEINGDLPLELNADDPYAARNSALAVNFNTVNLAWNASGTLISGEEQTPLTPLAREFGASLSAGEPQRINLGSDPEDGLRQAQQLFSYFLTESGVTILDSEFYQEAVSNEWAVFYEHSSSRSLREILTGMLRFSNNFIANQLFLTLGAQNDVFPATKYYAREVLQQQLSEIYGIGIGSDTQSLLMLEGSGLSRQQRSTASGMMRILETFRPYADLLPEINGALRKSGTLTGVYNFSGYIQGPDGLYPYVILTNQETNNRDEILQILRDAI
ncbi:MAG: D-alanyl-D-alanine carboxypeptidase [Gammaproteobacteria bacterium]|nr:D-alanyl-D-alanine carboxypeptidase [Gammaproteobacteria bacterium]